MAKAFQTNAFQVSNAFQGEGLYLTDTFLLTKPINCVLLDQQGLKVGPTEIQYRPANPRANVKASLGSGVSTLTSIIHRIW